MSRIEQCRTRDEFEKSKDNLEFNLDLALHSNSYLILVVDDFNAKPKNWYKYDKTSIEEKVIGESFSRFDLHQMSNNPTHFLDASSLCIDLTFTSQTNLASETSVSHPYIKFVIKRCLHNVGSLSMSW